METENKIGKFFLAVALIMLTLGLIFGGIASISYISPRFASSWIGFVQLRPLHVSCIMFFILIGASGSVYSGLNSLMPKSTNSRIAFLQLGLWLVAIIFILFSYSTQQFGGREYWEFPPKYAILIALAWLLFMYNFVKVVIKIKKWPVYIWMWMTGVFFFLLTFTENYLWEFPYFREHFVKDMTIQWKANGSLVGSWNQMIYGTAFFLMDKLSGNTAGSKSNLAFRMYFLGLVNLMFNWGHHIYTLPTENYIRVVSYAVSMTEWILLARIIYLFRKTVTEAQKLFHYFPFRFLFASEIWVFLNLALAILMSIPVLNLYTHGTHITVAHAMGTTIGINTMILLGACFEFMMKRNDTHIGSKVLNFVFWLTQFSLFVFWVNLIIIGLNRGMWQMQTTPSPFSSMMAEQGGLFHVFVVSGIVLMISLLTIAVALLNSFFKEIFSRKLSA
ncbi:MAG: cbb3-type cytochrome c oxidase subunit I [Bacteroidota bacterium]